MDWFKHYNESYSGELIGNLIAERRYDAVALWWCVLEFISRFEDPEKRGECSIPLSRIAQVMHMKPTRTKALLDHISLVSRKDLICVTDEKQPRNVVLLLRNWSKLQENRGGKKSSKKEQNSTEVRSKKLEVRVEEEAPPDGSVIRFDPIQLNEAVFSEEGAKFKKGIESAYEHFKEKPPHRIISNLPKLIVRFQTYASFRQSVESILNAKNCGDSRYLTAALLNELGLRKGAQL